MDTCGPPQNTGRCHYSGNDRLCIGFCRRKFNWIPALICCLFAGLMQVAANFINDLFDFLKGTDREDRLGPERACAQGWISAAAMKQGIFITVGLACLIGCTLLFYAGWELILIGALCVLFAFLYTTGPYPLSYKGWGGRIGHCILRLRSGRGYLLRTGSQLDTKRHGCITGMRTDCRYITGS